MPWLWNKLVDESAMIFLFCSPEKFQARVFEYYWTGFQLFNRLRIYAGTEDSFQLFRLLCSRWPIEFLFKKPANMWTSLQLVTELQHFHSHLVLSLVVSETRSFVWLMSMWSSFYSSSFLKNDWNEIFNWCASLCLSTKAPLEIGSVVYLM